MIKKQLQRDDDGNLIMNEHNIIIIAEKDGLYEYPELNTKLYLHFKAFRKISGLDNFINIKTLWLENNFITKIEGLECLNQLTHLFLQNNLITKLEGLNENVELIALNISNNSLKKVENIQKLQKLCTLDLSSNKFQFVSDIWELELNKSVSTLDLQNNLLEYQGEYEDDPLLCVFVKMPNLKCLYLQKNEYIRSIVNYRKYYLSKLPNLTYMDTQPVFPNERRIVDAWGKNGKEGEMQERNKILEEEKQKKNEYREEIRKSLPIYLKNKIIFFKKNIGILEQEVDEMEKRKEMHIIQQSPEIEITYLENTINSKIQQIQELKESINNMSIRQIKYEQQQEIKINDLSTSFIQQLQQQDNNNQLNNNLDEID